MHQQTSSLAELLRGHTQEVQATAHRLREIILEAVPQMREKVYAGWHGIGYTHPQAGYVCAIFPHKTSVKLGFEHGASLYDPDGLLKPGASKGKQVRYLELHTSDEVNPDVVVTLLFDAIRLKA